MVIFSGWKIFVLMATSMFILPGFQYIGFPTYWVSIVCRSGGFQCIEILICWFSNMCRSGGRDITYWVSNIFGFPICWVSNICRSGGRDIKWYIYILGFQWNGFPTCAGRAGGTLNEIYIGCPIYLGFRYTWVSNLLLFHYMPVGRAGH